mmetsp:Transcript_20504/g.24921  ORF Transcript_20504/g.24921 Transcript_20504/m.24921 type:complete len:83 (-) Transcript_20504:442-690(-)
MGADSRMRLVQLQQTGKRQFEQNIGGAKFMMLVADMALWWDPDYRKHVEDFDQHRFQFEREAAASWKKLTELGCEGFLTLEK